MNHQELMLVLMVLSYLSQYLVFHCNVLVCSLIPFPESHVLRRLLHKAQLKDVIVTAERDLTEAEISLYHALVCIRVVRDLLINSLIFVSEN